MKKILLPLFLLLALHISQACKAAQIPDLEESGLEEILAANKDKVVMLNFFATWCPPCRAEIPEIVQLRKDSPEKSLLIIGLSVDKSAQDVEPFVARTKINYPVYMAKPSITDAYGVTSVPHNAFYAPGGNLIISEPGIANFNVLKQTVSALSQ